MRKLTPPEVESIRETLALARSGKAGLARLGSAHELASEAGLGDVAAELLGHVRRLVGTRRAGSPARDVAVGVLSGLLTSRILGD